MEKIKNYFYFIIVIILFSFVIVSENYYKTKAVIVNVDNNIITAETKAGFLFDFYGSDFTIGDTVVLTINNNGSDTILTDDTVVKAKVIK